MNLVLLINKIFNILFKIKIKGDDEMSAFVARMVMKAYDEGGLEAGQNKYRAYYVKTNLYLKWKADTDTILEAEGYGDCIVTE